MRLKPNALSDKINDYFYVHFDEDGTDIVVELPTAAPMEMDVIVAIKTLVFLYKYVEATPGFRKDFVEYAITLLGDCFKEYL